MVNFFNIDQVLVYPFTEAKYLMKYMNLELSKI